METFMSKGPGKIERAIRAVFEAEPDNAFTTEELIERVYRGVNRIEKKHRVSVLRAGKSLAARNTGIDWLSAEGLGGRLVFFDRYSVLSYAMARLKATNDYRVTDSRLMWAYKWDRATGALTAEYGTAPHEKSEAELRARLMEGGDHHRSIVEGGGWWKHVREWTAERDGDVETAAGIRIERERDLARLFPQNHQAEPQT